MTRLELVVALVSFIGSTQEPVIHLDPPHGCDACDGTSPHRHIATSPHRHITTSLHHHMSQIVFRTDASITVDQFIDVLERSTLAQRRPVGDRACMEAMVANANLIATAWDDDRLVGV